MHDRVSFGVGIMVLDVGRVRVGGLVELMVWRSTWEEFEGEVVWLRGVIDEKREKFVGEVGGRVVWLRVCGWWVYFRYVGV